MAEEAITEFRCYLLRNADLPSLRDPEFSNRYAFAAGLQIAQHDVHPSYMQQGDGFGTTITLDVPEEVIRAIRTLADAADNGGLNYARGLVVDDRFPIGDGFTAPDPVLTYMWLLGDGNDPAFRHLTRGLPLADYPPAPRPFTAQFQKGGACTLGEEVQVVLLYNGDRPRLRHIGGLGNAHAHHAGVQLAARRDRHPLIEAVVEEAAARPLGYFDQIACRAAREETMKLFLEAADVLDVPAGLVVDPSYPVMDGFTVECPTAAWAVIPHGDHRRNALFGVLEPST